MGKQIKLFVFLLPFFLLAGVLTNGPVWGKAKPSGPIAVRVNAIDVPVLGAGKMESGILTVFIVAKSKLEVKTVCYWMPRIQVSILQMFHAEPHVKAAFEKLHLGDHDKAIFKTVREAMRRSKSVVRVHAIASARIPLKTVPWAKKLKIKVCKKKDTKKDAKKSGKKH